MITKINIDRSAFVFIEFQQEWIGETAFLRDMLVKDKAPFQLAVEHATCILDLARQRGCHIAHAGLDMRTDPAYRLFAGGREKLGLRGAIPKAGTWRADGAQFVPPFVPKGSEFRVMGRSGASVLKNSTLDPFLRNNGINTIILLGFALHVCVESTLREAHDLGLNAYVVTEACGAFEASQYDYFKSHILHHFGANLTVDETLALLKGP